MDERTPSWGITPVPERLRVLGLFDSLLLWGNLSVSLLVIVIGALLVPALSLKDALLAILVGAVVGNVLLGLAALIGADARVPGMVLLRAPLGRRGSYAPTLLNVAQNVGWSTFELIIIATAAAALSKHVFGFSGRWLWTIAFGVLSWGLGMLGPIGFVRRYLRKFASWALLFSMAYLTYWALSKSHLHAFWGRSGTGGFPSFGQAVDLVIGSVVSWTPLAADYTRFARSRRSAAWGAGVGYFVPTIWCVGLGILIVLARGVSDAQALPAAVAGAGGVALVALAAITIDESEKAFADIYSTAVSIQNLLPRVSQRLLITLVSDQPRELPDLPLPARLGVRAAVRGAARGLVAARRTLRAGRRLLGARAATGTAACLVRGLRLLPVALTGRPALVDGGRQPPQPGPRPLHGLAAELRAVFRTRARCRIASLGSCGRSRSSATSRSTSLTERLPASAARRTGRPARCASSTRRRWSPSSAPTSTGGFSLRPCSPSGSRCSGSRLGRRPPSRFATRETGGR